MDYVVEAINYVIRRRIPGAFVECGASDDATSTALQNAGRDFYLIGPGASLPAAVAILRLGVDEYRSTKRALRKLWPKVSVGGFVLIDRYEQMVTAKKAVDEFFSRRGLFCCINEGSGRSAVKV